MMPEGGAVMLIAPRRAVEPRRIAGIDVIARRRGDQRRSPAGLAARRPRPAPSARAGPACPCGVSRISPAIEEPGNVARAPCGPGLIGDRHAVLARRRRRTGRLRRTDRRRSAMPACAAQAALAADLFRRAPQADARCASSAAAPRGPTSASRSASCAGATSTSHACSLICCSSTSLSNG